MKFMVQTFIQEEVKELIYDSDKIQEWREKCESLGLDQQLALANGEKSPVPFECMNTVNFRVYETICPAKVQYKKYNRTTIPLEVLSLIALSESEGYFSEIQIWYDDKTPDPVAVGFIKENEWTFRKYLIARWGDALRPFEELKKMAMKSYHNSQRIALTGKIADYQTKLQNLDVNVERFFDAQVESYDVGGF